MRVTMKQKVSIRIKSFLKYLESVNIHTQHDLWIFLFLAKGHCQEQHRWKFASYSFLVMVLGQLTLEPSGNLYSVETA